MTANIYNRFAAAQAAGILPNVPYEFKEYPKLLYKGEGVERTSVTVEDEEQEKHFAAQGYAEHKPPVVERVKAAPKAAVVAVPKPMPVPAKVETKNVPVV